MSLPDADSPQAPSTSGGGTSHLWLTVRNLLAAFVLFPILFQVALVLNSPFLGHDQAWYFYAAQQVMRGTVLYGPQLADTNPPLVIWFSVLPALLGEVLHLGPALALHLVTLLLAAGTVLWCGRLLVLLHLRFTAPIRLLLLAAIAFILCNFAPYDVGQREHLLLILILPYVLAVGLDLLPELPRWEVFLLGLAAGVGVCFKPHHLLLFAACQLTALFHLRQRSPRTLLRSPELLAVAAAALAGILYVAAIALFAPLYFHSTVPILVDTYWAFGTVPALKLALAHRRYTAMLLGGAIVFLSARRFLGARRRYGLSGMPAHLFILSLAASFAFDLQHTGFFYQQFPQLALLDLALLWLAVEIVSGLAPAIFRSTRFTVPQTIAGAILVITFTFMSIRRTRSMATAIPRPPATLQDFMAGLPPGTPVFSLSTDLITQFPDVLLDNLVWTSRFVHLWMLPAVEQNQDLPRMGRTPAKRLSAATMERLAALQRDEVTEDIVTRRPQYIFVQRCTKPGDCLAIADPTFDILAWFQKSHAFAAAWSHYRYRQTLPNSRNSSALDLYEHQ